MSVLKYNKCTSVMHTHLKRHPLTLGEEQCKSSTQQQSITDFTKCPPVTECCVMSEKHTAANIADRLSEIIKEWGIQVFCKVHDNATNMNLAMELCKLFPNDRSWTGHTLQLAIKSGLVLPDIAKVYWCSKESRQPLLPISGGHLCLKEMARTTWHKSQKTPEWLCGLMDFHIRNAATAVRAKDRGAVCACRWNSNQAIHPKVTCHESITVGAAGTADSSSATFGQGRWNNVWWVGCRTVFYLSSPLTAVRVFKNTVRQQLETRFKLRQSDAIHPHRGLYAWSPV